MLQLSMTTMSAEYHREWYKKNKEKRLRLNKEWHDREVAKFLEYKKTLSCLDCGDDRTWVLDFHHLDPDEKEIAVSNAIYGKTWAMERVMKEIEKCVVLCANCHRTRHYQAGLAH